MFVLATCATCNGFCSSCRVWRLVRAGQNNETRQNFVVYFGHDNRRTRVVRVIKNVLHTSSYSLCKSQSTVPFVFFLPLLVVSYSLADVCCIQFNKHGSCGFFWHTKWWLAIAWPSVLDKTQRNHQSFQALSSFRHITATRNSWIVYNAMWKDNLTKAL